VTPHGTVVQFEFINPHAQITLDVKKRDGAIERWRIEVSNPNQLLREGWKKDVLKTGDQIAVEAYRARDGAHTGNGRQFILPDGRTLSSPGGPDESPASTDKPTVTTGVLRAQIATPQGPTRQANQTDNALGAEARRAFQSTSENILKAAREMPEDFYDFKPVGYAHTFGELMGHIADVQMTLCGGINGHQAKDTPRNASKEELLKDLTASVSECDTSFADLSDDNASKIVEGPTGQVTHLIALVYVITDAGNEYRRMSVYPHLNHAAPPSNDRVNSTT
jgi:hypothetical protein